MILKIKKIILNSQLLKNTLYLTTGTILAQLISVAISPILSRIYTPEDFGILGKLLAFTSIFIGISTLKFDRAIVLSKSPKETKQLINWSEFFIISFSILAVPCYAIIYSTSDLLIFIFLIIFLNSNFFLFSSIYTRYKKFKKLSYARVVNRLSSAIFQISLGFILGNVFGLIIGQLVGLIAFFSFISRNASSSFLNIFKFNKDTFKEAQPILKKHYRFPLYMAPQGLLNSFSQSAPILMMDSFFGNSVVGYYWFAIKIIQLPIESISNSIRQTFYQRASQIRSNEELMALLIKTTKYLFFLGSPFMIIGILVSPTFFSYFFGEEWFEAGLYAQWLLPWMFFAFINPPAVSLINILNLQKFNLIYDIVLLLFRVLAVYIGGVYFTPLDTIKIFSTVGIFFNIFFMIYVYFSLKSNEFNYEK